MDGETDGTNQWIYYYPAPVNLCSEFLLGGAERRRAALSGISITDHTVIINNYLIYYCVAHMFIIRGLRADGLRVTAIDVN
jgi:hypothetical protein